MERLTRPNISVDKDTNRYMNAKIGEKEFEWSTASDSVIDLILNGPALMGFSNDVLRKIIRELYVRLKPYEDLGLEPWQADAAKNIVEMAFEDKPERAERIRDLMRADKEGRVVVLPYKVGDKLYRVFAGEIFEHRVGRMKYFAIQGRWDIETYPFCPCVESSIGKTAFLTHEEAERALREIQGKEDADGTTDKPE